MHRKLARATQERLRYEMSGNYIIQLQNIDHLSDGGRLSRGGQRLVSRTTSDEEEDSHLTEKLELQNGVQMSDGR
jgi:hypothetical protein